MFFQMNVINGTMRDELNVLLAALVQPMANDVQPMANAPVQGQPMAIERNIDFNVGFLLRVISLFLV
jgi:hypothetical protein